jgi:hypothetical protein
MNREDNANKNSKVFNINKIINGSIETVSRIYKVEKSGKIHNIVEEENTIYEVDGRIDRYSDKGFYS